MSEMPMQKSGHRKSQLTNVSSIQASNIIGVNQIFEAGFWIAITIIVMLLPLLIRFLFCLVSMNFTTLNDITAFFVNGEFYVYSVSLLTPILYLSNDQKNLSEEYKKQIPYKKILFCLSASIVFFVIVICIGSINSEKYTVSRWFVFITSISAFIFSSWSAFKVRYFEIKTQTNNIKEQLEEETESLSNGMDCTSTNTMPTMKGKKGNLEVDLDE